MAENDEAKIFDYLSSQHERLLRHVDALDGKIAQVVALNGIVLSFIFDKLHSASSEFLFEIGLILILLSIGFGVIAFIGRSFQDGPTPKSYKSDGTINDLKELLIQDMEHNHPVLASKGRWFNIMLILNISGLTFVIIGYYV